MWCTSTAHGSCPVSAGAEPSELPDRAPALGEFRVSRKVSQGNPNTIRIYINYRVYGKIRARAPRARSLDPGISVSRWHASASIGYKFGSCKKHSTSRQTVQAIGWVKRPISDEINRIAKDNGQYRSRVIATLLEEAVHQRLHVQHAVMLTPPVRKAVVTAFQPWLPFLISIAYDTNQTRALTGNVLANTLRPEEMERIRERTAKKARESILHQRPQIEELVEAAHNWFAALEKEGEADPA
jgi:hypothetical protein